jgi:hypothetical protein
LTQSDPSCLDLAHTWFMPGMTGIKVYDLATGEARDSTGTDLATITRVGPTRCRISTAYASPARTWRDRTS